MMKNITYYDHEFGAHIYDNKQRRRRGVVMQQLLRFVFIASHYMAINYVSDENLRVSTLHILKKE